MLRSVCILLLFALPAAVVANNHGDYKHIVIDSFDRFENIDRDLWTFNVTRKARSGDESELTEESYNPAATDGPRWTLHKDKQQVPTATRLSKYQKATREKEAARKVADELAKSDPDSADKLIDMIDLDSLEIIEQNDQQVILSFTPQIEDMGENTEEKLSGRLTVNINENYVTQMKIKNTGKLSPAFSVSLSKLTMVFNFIKIGKHILPQNITTDIRGKVAFVKNLEQYSSDTYFDYHYLGQ